MCEELAITIPTPDEARWSFVRSWAQEIVSGDVTPIEGASRIWDEYQQLGRPDALAAFVGLASCWEDDAAHRHEYERDIVAEAAELLAGQP